MANRVSTRTAARTLNVDDKELARIIKNKKKNTRPWVFYDTHVLGSGTLINPQGTPSTTQNFANYSTPLPFFSGRNVSNAGYPITNMNDSGKMEADFICRKIMVDVWADVSEAGAATIPNAIAFVESIVHYASLKLSFGQTVVWVSPVARCPAGGGLYQPSLNVIAAAAAAVQQGFAGNGEPSNMASVKLAEPIFFEKGQVFSMALEIDNTATTGTLARINALQALATVFKAGIRVSLDGTYGEDLLKGTLVG